MEQGLEPPPSIHDTGTNIEAVKDAETTLNEAQETEKVPLRPRTLLRGPITYEEARDSDANILHELSYAVKRDEFFGHLERHRRVIRALAAHHLRLSPSACEVGKRDEWINGSFNVCIPIFTNHADYYMRFPLPYRNGETVRKGNADEKVRCEVATYAWLQRSCPDIRIPFLFGFGLSTGKTFTHIDYASIPVRISCRLRPKPSLQDHLFQSKYIETDHVESNALGSPYILIEYIGRDIGKMLACTWGKDRFDEMKRRNLFRGIARIIIQLARHPLPKIGSLTIDDQGRVSLGNRPLNVMVQQSENENFPPTATHHQASKAEDPEVLNQFTRNRPHTHQLDFYIDRCSTHHSMDSYVNDVFHEHERRLRYQPNGVRDLRDGAAQLTALVLLKSIWPRFFNRNLRQGPFFLTLTDMNQGNIFVDEDWNIKAVVDLEWACSLPLQMIHPPWWLSNEAIDCITPTIYQPLHSEFVWILEKEEREEQQHGKVTRPGSPDAQKPPMYPQIAAGLENGTFWISRAFSSPSALYRICYNHVFPRFRRVDEEDPKLLAFISAFWDIDAHQWIRDRCMDCERYEKDLLNAFKAEG